MILYGGYISFIIGKASFYIWCISVVADEKNCSLSYNKYVISKTLLMYN